MKNSKIYISVLCVVLALPALAKKEDKATLYKSGQIEEEMRCLRAVSEIASASGYQSKKFSFAVSKRLTPAFEKCPEIFASDLVWNRAEATSFVRLTRTTKCSNEPTEDDYRNRTTKNLQILDFIAPAKDTKSFCVQADQFSSFPMSVKNGQIQSLNVGNFVKATNFCRETGSVGVSGAPIAYDKQAKAREDLEKDIREEIQSQLRFISKDKIAKVVRNKTLNESQIRTFKDQSDCEKLAGDIADLHKNRADSVNPDERYHAPVQPPIPGAGSQ